MYIFSNLRQIPQLPTLKKKTQHRPSLLRNQHPQWKTGVGTIYNAVNLVILTAYHSFSPQQCTAVHASVCSLLCSQRALLDSRLWARTMGIHWLLSLSRAWQNVTGMSVPLHLLARWNPCRGWMEALTKELTSVLCWPSISSKPEKVLVRAYLLVLLRWQWNFLQGCLDVKITLSSSNMNS